MGFLKVITGCMFSGKTTTLINLIKKERNPLVINSILDTRPTSDSIMSHNNEKIDSLKVNKLCDVDITNYSHIFVDEAQFFEDLLEFVKKCMTFDKHLVIAGLDGDYKQNPFGQIVDCIPLADEIYKFTSKCYVCGNTAPFTKRIVNSDQCILVGAENIYKPSCRLHLNEWGTNC